MTARHILAIDQGTTSTRAIVFDGNARPVATAQHELPQIFPNPGWVEHDPEEIWSAWIPLADGPPELGGLALIPGSHRGGLRAHVPLDERGERIVGSECAPWAAAPMRCGDVVFLSCLTVHRGLANRSRDRIRISVDYRYQPARDATRPLREVRA